MVMVSVWSRDQVWRGGQLSMVSVVATVAWGGGWLPGPGKEKEG